MDDALAPEGAGSTPADGADRDPDRTRRHPETRSPEVDGDGPGARPGDEIRLPDFLQPSRRTLFLLIGPIVLLSAAGTIATAFTPTLATQHPLLLIALDARNRMLVLAREVDIVPFMAVAIVRRTLSDPLFYLLGLVYGDRAVRWIEKKAGGGTLVTTAERWFKKASYPMVFAFPGAIVCALAGATRMRPIGFAVANVTGTLASVTAVRIFSDAVANPVEALLGFFDRNLVLTTSITVALVVLSLVLNTVQGRLDPDLDELEDEAGGTQDGARGGT